MNNNVIILKSKSISSNFKSSENQNLDKLEDFPINDENNFDNKFNVLNKYKFANIIESDEERNKEFFSNSPYIYFLIKIFLLFEGQITRILIQLGDLYFSCIITNIYLEIIIIQLCASAESSAFIKLYGFISALIFCFLMKIIISIAYWELYQLKWFDLNPFNSITDLLNLKLKQYVIRNIYYIVNIFFGILFWVFILGFLTMSTNNGQLLDAINLIVLIIPLIKFLIIYFGYIYLCIKNLIHNNIENDSNPFEYWMKLNNLIDQGVIKIGKGSDEDNEKDNKLNCFEKFLCKDIVIELKCKEKILTITLKTLLKFFFTLLSFIYCIYLFSYKGVTIGSVFFLIFVYLISLIISIQFSTPLWFINSIYRWHLKMRKKYDRKYQMKCRLFNEKFSAFKVLDSLPLIVSLIIIIFFILTIIVFNFGDSHFYTTEEKISEMGEFKVTDWKREHFSEIKNIENAICFTDIHGLSLLKISSLAFASYMNDPENITKYYEQSFFKEKTEKITNMTFLDKDSKYSVILRIDIDIPNQKPLTVFSIQASIKRLDYWLDFEIFCSSALFSLIRIITINDLESLTSNAITWLLTIPIRILEKFTLFNKYIEYLNENIDKEIEAINGTRNIIFTGHSLGGGMAKYLGLKYHKENVAVSGPGITSLEYKFNKDDNYYKYFKSNLIDIVPDNDIIPRIETSGGIKYRVLCKKDYISCHQMKRIICQIGATCRREDLTGDLCMSIFGKDDYQQIRDLAGIKSKIPEDY